MIGLSIAGTGVGLVAATFITWGRARVAITDADAVGSVTWSFPGIGKPDNTGTYYGDAGSAVVKLTAAAIDNTNPGWMSIVVAVVALIAGGAYLWLPQRKIPAIAVAVVGGVAGVICCAHLSDVRGTFGDPPNLADADFSPGIGLIGTCVLSFGLTALGVTASVLEGKRTRSYEARSYWNSSAS